MNILPIKFNILPLTDDRIFKLILTAPDARLALMDLISVIILKPVTNINILNIELPIFYTQEKAERLDINCEINNNSQVNIEMQANYIKEKDKKGKKNFKGKYLYYAFDLYSSQDSKGKQYDELMKTYQIIFCSYTIFPEEKEFIHPISMRHDKSHRLFSDAMNIVIIELSKLRNILKKSVSEMTDLEKWLIFLRYANNPKYRSIIKDIIESKGEIKLVNELLMEVSQDKKERSIFRSRKKFQTDFESNIRTAEKIGMQKSDKKWQGIVANSAKLIANKDVLLADKDALLADKNVLLADKDTLLADKAALLADKDAMISKLRAQLALQ